MIVYQPGDVVRVVRSWMPSVKIGMVGHVVEQCVGGDVLVAVPGTDWDKPGLYLAYDAIQLVNRPTWRDDPVHAQVEDTTYDGQQFPLRAHLESLEGERARVKIASTFGVPAELVGDTDATNPKDALGVKKAALRFVPPALMIAASDAMADGAAKYGPYNWRQTSVRTTVYGEAMLRHLLAYLDGQDDAEDSGHSHLAHIAACCGILLDAAGVGRLIDDRPSAGAAADMLRERDRT